MSVTSALTVSMSGIRAASTMLELTASNISNAQTEGYTTKSVVTSSALLGNIGGGTNVTGFERAENNSLYVTLAKATANNGLRSAQDDYLSQVQDIFGTSNSDNPTLNQALSSFVSSWTNLAATPESLVTTRQVVQDAQVLVDEIVRISSEVEDLDRQCFAEVNSTLKDLNSYLEQIKDLNVKIAQAYNSGLSSGDLRDQRDVLVLRVAEITGVTILQRGFGQIALYSATGYQLVDGGAYREFVYDGTDVTSAANTALSLNEALGGGSLQALVDFRSTTAPVSTSPGVSVIQKLRSQLDGIADAFLSTTTTATSGEVTFATAYNSATTGAGQLASGFFTGTDRTDIAVNAALLNGTSSVKSGAAQAVTDALLDATRSFSADGLTISNSSYMSLFTSSITSFQQAANNIATLADTAANAHDYLKEKYTNETGVNVDNELINLTTFQNAYAASAHAMSVVKEMFHTLENLL
ncbi:MAG: flagellar hook-associated protein FlgK [Proteobacteria bacterium]|jgi:flagellar hook-associated protein 1 FlgK|nr:flagellar hook-associated protein FlgK [Alphaproteobacteria bacterium]NCC04006.1 flagellar hook-associated protein FlgK [Pseudomonadota bacterium]